MMNGHITCSDWTVTRVANYCDNRHPGVLPVNGGRARWVRRRDGAGRCVVRGASDSCDGSLRARHQPVPRGRGRATPPRGFGVPSEIRGQRGWIPQAHARHAQAPGGDPRRRAPGAHPAHLPRAHRPRARPGDGPSPRVVDRLLRVRGSIRTRAPPGFPENLAGASRAARVSHTEEGARRRCRGGCRGGYAARDDDDGRHAASPGGVRTGDRGFPRATIGEAIGENPREGDRAARVVGGGGTETRAEEGKVSEMQRERNGSRCRRALNIIDETR